jgi:hypothetical protein
VASPAQALSGRAGDAEPDVVGTSACDAYADPLTLSFRHRLPTTSTTSPPVTGGHAADLDRSQRRNLALHLTFTRQVADRVHGRHHTFCGLR